MGTLNRSTSQPLERYLAGLTVTQGRHAGELFTVLPWERRFVRGAFAPGVRSAALAVARGNGKTTLVAGVACAFLVGPMVERRGEVVIVASAFSQARIAFEHVMAFLDPRDDPGRWRIQDSQNVATSSAGGRGRAFGASAVIREGRTAWRLYWCWQTSRVSGRTLRATRC